MAITLEQYVAEATNAFKPARNAVQTQLDAIPGQLQTANEAINRNYAQQQSQLNDQRNAASTAASLQAAGSGGSFGGQANLANRRYYTQSFVPAQTQLQTNQSNELQRTRQSYDDKRTSLNSQLSSIDAQANEMALNKYWAAVEAEKQRQWEAEQAEKARQAQRAAAAAQAAAQNDYMQYFIDALKNRGQNQLDKSSVGFTDWIKSYSGWNDNTKNTWLKNLNSIYSLNGAVNSQVQNALNAKLQNTDAYKQYLNWQRS